jgi:HSP20 family protein
MTYLRYSPWTTLPRPVRDSALVPDVDVREAAEQYHISVDLPGVAPADISVTTEHGVLTIRAERQTAENIAAEGYSRIERRTGTYLRRFTLPEDADAGAIAARSVHGVLEVTIGKQAKAQPRRVEVEAA